jgi:cyanosortase A-associated protein
MIVMWEKVRIPTLALTCGGVLFVLGNVILRPVADVAIKSNLQLPETISLPQWQQVKNQPLAKPNREGRHIILQSRYQYVQDNSQVDIEMRYVNSGDLPALLRKYLDITPRPVIRQQKDVGFYGLGIDEKTAYLSTCITPNAKTTFTSEQFNQNSPQTKNKDTKYWISWLLGNESLGNQRCLWTHLSMPISNANPEVTYKALEKIWFSWYQVWLPQVPNL